MYVVIRTMYNVMKLFSNSVKVSKIENIPEHINFRYCNNEFSRTLKFGEFYKTFIIGIGFGKYMW